MYLVHSPQARALLGLQSMPMPCKLLYRSVERDSRQTQSPFKVQMTATLAKTQSCS
jgi:hypothetical protein